MDRGPPPWGVDSGAGRGLYQQQGHLPTKPSGELRGSCQSRALCRIKLLPVTHVLVDTWMLTVKLVYKHSDVPDDLKWTTNTHDTIYTHFQGKFFFLLLFFTRPPYFYSFLPVQMTVGRVSTCVKVNVGFEYLEKARLR